MARIEHRTLIAIMLKHSAFFTDVLRENEDLALREGVREKMALHTANLISGCYRI